MNANSRGCIKLVAAGIPVVLLALAAQGCGSGTGPATPTPPATTTPIAPVTVTVPATVTAAVTATQRTASEPVWPTYHADLARTGVDPADGLWSAVTRQWESEALDGDVYAEPLVAGEQVIVATENNSLYSLDASSGKVVWRAHLGDPVPGASLPCGDIDPSGITGTPVIDPTTGLVYAVTFVPPAQHDLVAVDLSSGVVRFRVPVDPAGADPRVQQQRAALTLSNGMVYVAFGGLFGDCGQYHGWVVAVPSDGSGQPIAYRVEAGRAAGIWAPPGPAVDASGSVFVATGNSDAVGTPDLGDSVLRLSSDLRLLESFTPSDWAELNARDLDLGSEGPALLDNGLILQIGKTGTGYLLSANHLGGIGGQVYAAPVCSGAYGGVAYRSPYVYVPCRDGLAQVQIGSDLRSFAVGWRGPAFEAGPPIIAGGAIWTVDLSEGTLYGLDPATGKARFQESVGAVTHFTTPTAAGGRLLLAAQRKVIAFIGQ